MQKKIIESNGKFKVKLVDFNGNSLGILPEVFETEADAKIFMDSQDQAANTEAQPSEAAPAENTPAPEATPASDGSETASEQAPA